MYASFKSIGAYKPSTVRTNKWFEDKIDTTDEWIFKRTGIRERLVAAENENTSDLGTKAAEVAIQRAGIEASDIDLVICATLSPDFSAMPSTACLISEKLGIQDVMAFDISAACTGFVYALSVAKAFIESGMKKNVLIVGAEKASNVMDYTDRNICMLFGDGAGAAIISTTEDKEKSIIDVQCSADGKLKDILYIPGVGSPDEKYMHMKGNETFKIAVKTLTSDVEKIMAKNNYVNEDIDLFIPHQANIRIIKAVGKALKLTDSQKVLTVEKYGNTSAASIPMAMNDCFEDGRLTNGKTMLLDAFGGGATWGSAIVKFNG
jgi:3-oxoacyl-[acyl-carrier-protein] synthase-3